MNGYMKASILGKERGLKFGMPAIEKITLAVGQKELNGLPDTQIIYEMIYWGLWNNCYIKRETPDFDFEHVADWVDENLTNVELFEQVAECFKSSKAIKAELDKQEQKKSNLTSKRKKAGTNLESIAQVA
jgi:hypothetical protein